MSGRGLFQQPAPPGTGHCSGRGLRACPSADGREPPVSHRAGWAWESHCRPPRLPRQHCHPARRGHFASRGGEAGTGGVAPGRGRRSLTKTPSSRPPAEAPHAVGIRGGGAFRGSSRRRFPAAALGGSGFFPADVPPLRSRPGRTRGRLPAAGGAGQGGAGAPPARPRAPSPRGPGGAVAAPRPDWRAGGPNGRGAGPGGRD